MVDYKPHCESIWGSGNVKADLGIIVQSGRGGGREKSHPGTRNFNPVGGGQVLRLKKKHPKLKKFPVGWGISGTAVGVEKMHVSGAKLVALE